MLTLPVISLAILSYLADVCVVYLEVACSLSAFLPCMSLHAAQMTFPCVS